MAEKKQPIRLTQQRAEALVAVFEVGAATTERELREALQFHTLTSVEEAAAMRARDVQLAAARDAIAILRHRYLHEDAPTEAHEPLF